MEEAQKSVVRKITVLNPFPTVRPYNQRPDKKLLVAAYCRVSSTSDEQLVSYHNQVTYYESYIRSHPNYVLAGIFADEGVSGTDLRKRDEFNRLMQAARDGQIDMIITKSLSRFGRNSLECLKNIRELRTLGVDVYFEKENIHVLRSEGEMLLTLIAGVAQNESLNQSENVKWGIRRQYERGNIKSIQSCKFLGYRKEKNGYLIIDETQADTVHRIYQLYLDGLGVYQIAILLTEENVPMAYGGKEWSTSHIVKVLTNEKHKGDTRFQKTYNADFLTKRRVKNTGQLPQYYLENTHPAIIDRETWALVQLEITRQKQFVKDHRMDKFHHHSEEIPMSGKLICSACGRILLLRETSRIASENEKYWQCAATLRAEKTCGCNQKLADRITGQALVSAWNALVSKHDRLDLDGDSKLIQYRQGRLKSLLEEYGVLETMPYDLILKVLDHIEVHAIFLNVIFLAGINVRIDLPVPTKPHPRWTHTRKAKSEMALRRMELGLTQAKLAEQAGVARGYLNRVENGLAMPTVEFMQKLIRVFESIESGL